MYASLAIEFHRLVLGRLRALGSTSTTVDCLREILSVFWEVYSPTRSTSASSSIASSQTQTVGRRQHAARNAGTGEWIRHGDSRAREAGHRRGRVPNRPIPLLLFGAQAALVGALKLLWIGALSGPKEQSLEELTVFVLAGLTRSARSSVRGGRSA